jgi:hypothetical protein
MSLPQVLEHIIKKGSRENTAAERIGNVFIDFRMITAQPVKIGAGRLKLFIKAAET